MKKNLKTILTVVLLISITSLCGLAEGKKPEKAKKTEPAKAKTKKSFFDERHMPVIEVTIAKKDWVKLCSESREFVPSLVLASPPRPFNYYRGDVKVDGKVFKSVGIRKKGFIGSLDGERPSLKIKFNQYQKNGKYAGLDRLTLNNNKQDRAIVSQYLTYRLFRQVGVKATRCNLCQVFVNGQNLGIYSNVESVKPAFLKRNFGSAKGNLYEGTLADFYEDRIDRFQKKNNKKKGKKRKDLLRVARALAKIKTNKKGDSTPVHQLVAIDDFLKFWAVESLVGFWDGYSSNQNNFFVYMNPSDKKLHFIPWGADSAFTDRRFMLFMDKYKSVNARGLLCNRLYNDPVVRMKYHQTLLGILKKQWNEKDLLAEIDRVEASVKDKLHRNQRGIRRALRSTRKFVKGRRASIMREIRNGPVKVTTKAGRPAYMAEIGEMSGTFLTDWKTIKRPGKISLIKAQGRIGKRKFELQQAKGDAKSARRRSPGMGVPPQLSASIEINGKRSSDARNTKIVLLFSRISLDAKNEEITITGQMTEGSGFFSGFSAKPIAGHLTLIPDKDKKKPGKGSFSIKIYEMRNMFGRRD